RDTLFGRCESAGGRRASADSAELALGLVGPGARAETVEESEGGDQMLAGGAFLFCPSLGAAGSEQRACELERRLPVPLGSDRAGEQFSRCSEIAVAGGDETEAAFACGEQQWALDRLRLAEVRLDEGAGALEVSRGDQGFERLDREGMGRDSEAVRDQVLDHR